VDDPIPKMCKVLILHFLKVYFMMGGYYVDVLLCFSCTHYLCVSLKINLHKLKAFLGYNSNACTAISNCDVNQCGEHFQ
jgi:hypothetical protein